MGFLFRSLCHHAKDNDLLNDGIYGNHKGRHAHDPVLLDITQVKYSQITRTILAKFSNDMQSCYDRVMAHMASISWRAFGLTKKCTQLCDQVLKKAKFRIRTTAGLSDEYTDLPESHVFGLGQGFTAASSGWMFQSAPAIDIQEQYEHGSNYQSPDGQNLAKVDMTIFVDDANSTANGTVNEDGQTVVQHLAHDAELWSQLLRATEGSLNLSKCFFQVF